MLLDEILNGFLKVDVLNFLLEIDSSDYLCIVYSNNKQFIAMDQDDFDAIKKIKKENKLAYNPWSRKDDDDLINLFFDGVAVGEMAIKLKRTKGAIRARIRKMELTKIKKKASPSADSTRK